MDKESDEIQSLSKQEMDFVNAYVIDHNASAAYLKAFGDLDTKGNKRNYGTLRKLASDLVAKPRIRAEIRAAEANICKRNRVTPLRVVAEYAAIAFANAGDVFDFDTDGLPVPKAGRKISYQARKAISEIKTTTRTIPGRDGESIIEQEVKYRFHSKHEALAKLYTHLGMSPETNQLEAFLKALPDGTFTREDVARLLQSAVNPKSNADPDPVHIVDLDDESEQ
jgi:hypothetical protein